MCNICIATLLVAYVPSKSAPVIATYCGKVCQLYVLLCKIPKFNWQKYIMLTIYIHFLSIPKYL